MSDEGTSAVPIPTTPHNRLGIDCEDIEKWRHLLDGHPEQVEGLFNAKERDYCSASGDPAEAYAGCWCAKEAVCKALGGFSSLLPSDIMIDHDAHGRPIALIHPGKDRGYRVDISISHCGVCAIAVALVLG